MTIGGTPAIILLAAMQGAPPPVDPPRNAPAQGTVKVDSKVLDKQLQAAQAIAEVATLPLVTVKSIDQVVQFRMDSDMVLATTPLGSKDAMCRIAAPDLPGILSMRVFVPPAQVKDDPAGSSSLFIFKQQDFAAPGSWQYITTVQATGGQLIIARDGEDGQSTLISIQLVQSAAAMAGQQLSDDPMQLLVMKMNLATGNKSVDLKLTAKTFTELKRDHPKEVDEYLRPIFRDFKQEGVVFGIDQRAAWQVLVSDWQADQATKDRVKAAIAKFDSDSFQEREAAQKSLAEIGQPAALVLMQMDRKSLSPEATNGVDTFMAQYAPLKSADVDLLRNDPKFLLDTLYNDDATVRTIAASRLAKVINRSIDFDPNASVEVRSAKITSLRSGLSNATTKPAGTP